jgi:glucose/arabinose dehydrogenase
MLPVQAQETNTFYDQPSGVRYTVDVYVPANFPVGLSFAPDGRLFYNEKITGNVRVVNADGETQPEPVVNLPTDALVERGMLGIEVDPNFEENHYVWVVHTALGTARDWPSNKLIRFREDDGIAQDVTEILSLPIETGELLHNGGNVHFDAEGLLYISFGDYGVAANAQDISTMQGGIHRFEVNGDELIPAEGNPFEGNSLWAYGFRNPFDFDFDPITGNIITTENGPDCDDEINMVLPGFNYGWGEDYECLGMGFPLDIDLYMPPILSFTPTIAPTGVIVYNNPAIPEWQGDIFYCAWNTGELTRVILNETRSSVLETHIIDLGDASCKLDITVGPDGGLYFGSIGDDAGWIYRLFPI